MTNLSQTDIRLLKVFTTVVDSGGFSAAQITLNVSQSTISTHMQALEQRLGIRLCERGRSGFSLTERGHKIYQASLQLFEAIDDFKAEVGVARNSLIGTLTIGMVDCVISNPGCAISNVITTFNDHAPEVHLALRMAAPAEIERLVLDGHCDIGIGTCGRHSPYLSYEDVFEERQTLYCSKRHPLFASKEDFCLADLQSHRLVRRSYDAPEAIPPGEWLGSAASADLMESVALLILSGCYVGFLPSHYAASWVQKDEMRPLLDEEIGYSNPIYLVTRKTEKQRPVAKAFSDQLFKTQALMRAAV